MLQSYQLIIDVSRPITIEVGKIGKIRFERSKYSYVGSARRNMEARIARHQTKSKPLKWHVDWLTSHPAVRVVDVLRSEKSECKLNASVKGAVVVKGFGSSDCKALCGSHLKRLQ